MRRELLATCVSAALLATGCSKLERLSIVKPTAERGDWTQVAPEYEVSDKGRKAAPLAAVQLLAAATEAYRAGDPGLSATYAVFVFFAGLFLAFEPRTYRRGLLAVVPARGRRKASEVVDTLGHRLRWWLLGRCFTMAVIAVLTTAGLCALHVPLALALGALAGLLNFVPYVGPLIAAAPAVLLAMADGPQRALWVAGLFLVLQSIEGYVLTPLVDRRSVSLPPALTLAAQMSMALLAGGAGVVLASPLLVCVLVVAGALRGAAPEEEG